MAAAGLWPFGALAIALHCVYVKTTASFAVPRFDGADHTIGLVLTSALPSLPARAAKDGTGEITVRGHRSRRPPQEAGSSNRFESLDPIRRYV
jgi:hypothetical protein